MKAASAVLLTFLCIQVQAAIIEFIPADRDLEPDSNVTIDIFVDFAETIFLGGAMDVTWAASSATFVAFDFTADFDEPRRDSAFDVIDLQSPDVLSLGLGSFSGISTNGREQLGSLTLRFLGDPDEGFAFAVTDSIEWSGFLDVGGNPIDAEYVVDTIEVGRGSSEKVPIRPVYLLALAIVLANIAGSGARGLSVFTAIAIVLATTGVEGARASETTTYQIDATHAGATQLAGPLVFPSAPAWSTEFSDDVSFALVVDKRAFVLVRGASGEGRGNRLYALDVLDGSVIWGPAVIVHDAFRADFGYYDGAVFVVLESGEIIRFDAETGARTYRRALGVGATTAPVTPGDGILFVGGEFGAVVVDPDSGAVLWRSTGPSHEFSSPALVEDRLFLAPSCKVAAEVDIETQAVLWRSDQPCSSFGGRTPAVSHGVVFARGSQGTINRFGTEGGEFLGALSSTLMPAMDDQFIYTVNGNTVEAVERETQLVAWTNTTSSPISLPPVVVNDSVFVATNGGRISAFDRFTGARVWLNDAGIRINPPDEFSFATVLTGMSVGAGMLMVPVDNHLTAFSLVDVGANDDAVVAYSGRPVSIDALANDFLFEDPVTVTIIDEPEEGAVAIETSVEGLQRDVRLVYTPNASFVGADAFTYQISDGISTSQGRVSVDVQPIQVTDDRYVVGRNEVIELDVLGNDLGLNELLSIEITMPPQFGEAVVNNSPGSKEAARVQYSPPPGFVGLDTFYYTVDDGAGTATAEVTVEVIPFEAVDDTYVVLRSTRSIYLDVLANDFGFSKQDTTLAIETPPTGSATAAVDVGSFSLNDRIYYEPNNASGTGEVVQTMRYRATEGDVSLVGEVTVKVVDFLAQDDFVTTDRDRGVTIDVTENDLGFDRNPTIGLFVAPRYGSVSLTQQSSWPFELAFRYLPYGDFLGTDTFQYAIDDGVNIGFATVEVTLIDDSDGDFVDARQDNCLDVANPEQRDVDNDGVGDLCDFDVNNDGFVNFLDLSLFRSAFGTNEPLYDFNSDGRVNFGDLELLQERFGTAPGPAAQLPNPAEDVVPDIVTRAPPREPIPLLNWPLALTTLMTVGYIGHRAFKKRDCRSSCTEKR